MSGRGRGSSPAWSRAGRREGGADIGGRLSFVSEPAREIPVRWRADVVVCGGGPAGTAAAIAAARSGADTLLLERYGCLGGLATAGLVILLPPFRDSGRPVIGGIGSELRQRMLDSQEAASERPGSDTVLFDPEALKWHSLDACRSAGARLLHHVWVAGCVCRAGRIEAVIVESKAGRLAVAGDVFVDATGDGDLLAHAGAPFEASTQAMGLPFRLHGVEVEVWRAAARGRGTELSSQIATIFAESGFDGWCGLTPMPTPERGVWANNMLCEADGLDPEALTRVETTGRDAIRQAVARLRAEIPGFERAWLLDTASQVGVRRSRRLAGEYVLTESDVSAFDTRFADGVGRGNDFRREGPCYDIPYRALVPRGVANLLVAGRCVSATHEALEPLREIHVCWVMGQAAGTAAALAHQRGVGVRDVPVDRLRASLLEAGVVL